MTGSTGPSRRHLLRAAGSGSLGFLVSGTTPVQARSDEPSAAPLGPLADLLRADALDAREFGARFDGATDDALALQRAVNAAHEGRRPLRLPAGVAVLGRPLSLKSRDVALVGTGMTGTVLRAGRAMPALIDVEEPVDRIVSPFSLMRLTLDGAGLAERGLAVRHRHHSFLFEVNAISAGTGFWEKDCWLARRYNCRSGDNRVGWHLVGANHSSLWEACTIVACGEAHLRIGNQGTAPDGNAALLFRGCDVEFGPGHGVELAPGVNAVFESCYLGENIGGDVVRNQGFLVVRGGVFFFGGGNGVGVRPLAGRAHFDKVSINAQGGGVANLVNLTPAEAAAPGGHGQVSIADANANLPVGGLPLLQGAPLARVPMTIFAPRLGRDWRAWVEGAQISEASPADLPDGRLVRCARATDPSARLGLRAPLADVRWRDSVPVYLACVYRATAPVDLALTVPGTGARQPIITLPASPQLVTALNLTTTLPARAFAAIEASMPAAPGAMLGLQELTLADGNNIRIPGGTLKTLALAE